MTNATDKGAFTVEEIERFNQQHDQKYHWRRETPMVYYFNPEFPWEKPEDWSYSLTKPKP